MPEEARDAVPLCASPALAEKGRAVLFDVLHFGQPARAFALRFDGRVVAYLNRCAHVPTELDWLPGNSSMPSASRSSARFTARPTRSRAVAASAGPALAGG
jgi:hypothetical protein